MSSDKAYILRCCGPNGESHKGFRWPLEIGAVVTAPDWKPTAECGNGLHGWLDGIGDYSVSNYSTNHDAVWLVVSAPSDSIIDIGGSKVKFPSCVIEFVGSMADAADFIRRHSVRAQQGAVIGANVSGINALVGALGTATAGNWGTATAGDYGTATAGNRGTATAGDWGTATAGDYGTIIIKRYDGERHRLTIGYTGENGIAPNVAYRCNELGNLERVDK